MSVPLFLAAPPHGPVERHPVTIDRRSALAFAIAGVACATLAPAQTTTTTTGYNLALRSNGTRSSTAGTATLTQNGYVGTYVTLAAPGSVTLSVDAVGQLGGGVAPRMNLVVDDSSVGWSVGATAGTYSTTLNLPAGTHLVRAEFANDVSTVDRRLTIQNLKVTGAAVANASTSANALAAADTYVANYRKGSATVAIGGVAPGTSVGIRLKNHAFRFGASVPGFSTASSVNTYLRDNPTPGSTAALYQQKLLENFNGVTPANAGKWSSNEATQNVLTMGGVDRVLDFAAAHDLRVRQHNLIWGNQQPTYVNNLITAAAAGDAAARASLDKEVAERVGYAVRDRATRYEQIDVYNESYHTGQANPAANYWGLYGPAGIAKIHNDVAAAVTAAGAKTRLFTNEYNVLNENVSDPFANYYRSHVDALREAGGQVDGVGIQYYAHDQLGTAAPQHDAARAYATLANMSVGGLPVELTEFGIKGDGTGTAAQNEQTAAQILGETMRLVFGTPGATGFTSWGFWAGDVWDQAPAGALYNLDWSLTPAGLAYRDLMTLDGDADATDDWTTQLAALVRPDGTIAFDGFYGDYELTIDGRTYALTLEKGVLGYAIQAPEPSTAMAVCGAICGALGRRRSMRRGPAASK